MSNLSKIAKEIKNSNPILEGRTKIDSADVCRLYKNGFTPAEIARVDITDKKTGDAKHYYYIRIVEDDSVIISTGSVVTDFFDRMIDSLGTIEDINTALEDKDFVLIPEMVKSKNGNKYMTVTVAE